MTLRTPFVAPASLALGLFAIACPAAEQTEGSSGSSSGAETSTTASTTATTATTATTNDSDGESSSSGNATTASTTLTTTATTAPDTGDTQVGECGPDAACSGLAPAGWFGPAIFSRTTDGAELPACPGGYDEAGPTVLEGWHDPGAASCGCDCELSAAMSCSGYKYSHNNAQCYDYLYYAAVSEMCTNTTVLGYNNFFTYLNNQPTCMKTQLEDIPPVQWDATVRSCKLPGSAVACADGGGVCTPLPPDDFEANLCVYKQGASDCPAGEYAVKRTFFSGVEDTRGCSNCSCGAAPTTCDGAMLVFAEADCAGDYVAAVQANNGCTAATGNSVAMELDTLSGCPVTSDSTPEGDVAPTGEFTFCCQG